MNSRNYVLNALLCARIMHPYTNHIRTRIALGVELVKDSRGQEMAICSRCQFQRCLLNASAHDLSSVMFRQFKTQHSMEGVGEESLSRDEAIPI